MSVHIQLRRDTAANWTANDPIPAEGELCVELVTNRFKMGDGITKWSLLSYTGIVGDADTVDGNHLNYDADYKAYLVGV